MKRTLFGGEGMPLYATRGLTPSPPRPLDAEHVPPPDAPVDSPLLEDGTVQRVLCAAASRLVPVDESPTRERGAGRRAHGYDFLMLGSFSEGACNSYRVPFE